MIDRGEHSQTKLNTARIFANHGARHRPSEVRLSDTYLMLFHSNVNLHFVNCLYFIISVNDIFIISIQFHTNLAGCN